MKKLRSIFAVVALFSAGLPAQAVEPLNEFKVVAIDARSATVTARDNKTGNTFKFKVNDQRMLKAIKVGDAGQADFKTGKVTVQPKGTMSPIAGVMHKSNVRAGKFGSGSIRLPGGAGANPFQGSPGDAAAECDRVASLSENMICTPTRDADTKDAAGNTIMNWHCDCKSKGGKLGDIPQVQSR